MKLTQSIIQTRLSTILIASCSLSQPLDYTFGLPKSPIQFRRKHFHYSGLAKKHSKPTNFGSTLVEFRSGLLILVVSGEIRVDVPKRGKHPRSSKH